MEEVPLVLCRFSAALLIFIFCCCLTIGAYAGDTLLDHDGLQRGEVEGRGESVKPPITWRQITRDNATSELEKHEFSLCIATLPWCGESRSLMKSILRLVKEDRHSFQGLQLFFLYTNTDPLTEEFNFGGSTPSLSLFSYGAAYRYSGRWSAPFIMASVRHGMSYLQNNLLLPHIDTFPELENFVDSTDKAVLLLDFCGWERRLRQQLKRISITDATELAQLDEIVSPFTKTNGEKNSDMEISSDRDGTSSGKSGEVSYREQQSRIESSTVNTGRGDGLPLFDVRLGKRLPTTEQKSSLERTVGAAIDDMEDCLSQAGSDSLYCLSGNTFRGLNHDTLVSAQFSGEREPGVSVKDTGAAEQECQDKPFQDLLLCTREEEELFTAVYQNVSKLAADTILTPQRARFAVVTNEEVARQAGILTQGRPWLLMYRIHDFDRVPYYFYGEGDVEEFLSGHSTPLVIELQGSYHSSLLNDTPSVILFIDRMSNSQEIRVKSREALEVVRALSHHYASLSDSDSGEENETHKKKLLMERRRLHAKDNEKASSQLASRLHIEQRTTKQVVDASGLLKLLGKTKHVVESSRLLKLLGKSSLETGALQGGEDGRVVFELISDEHQLSDTGDGEAPNIHLARLANLKLLEEKVMQTLVSGAGSVVLPLQISGRQPQHSEESFALCEDESCLRGLTSFQQRSLVDVLGEPSVADSSGASPIRKDEEAVATGGDQLESETQSSLLTEMDMETTHPVGTDTGHGDLDVNAQVCVDDLMGKPCTRNRDDALSHSEESSTISENSLLETNDPTINDEQTSRDFENKLPDDDLEQFVVDEDEDEESYSRIQNGVGFYFVDGEDHIKERLTMSKTTPALVIINPEKEAHYVFPLNLVLNLSSMISFVNSVLSGELKRSVQSQLQVPPQRQPPRPPFVNRDFHEIYPVPPVTIDSFSKLVTGVCEGDGRSSQISFHEDAEKSKANGGNFTESAWEKDVLVLFTTGWCGFCKRMELVVREVYRSFMLVKGLQIPATGRNLVSDEQQKLKDPSNANSAWCAGDVDVQSKAACDRRIDMVGSEPPVLLQMDCTLNDCSDHLGELLEEETYPAVVLFPAKKKFSPVVYNGGPTVQGIYDFLKAYGTAKTPAPGNTGDSQKSQNEKLGLACVSTDDLPCARVPTSASVKIGSVDGRRLKKESGALLLEINSRQSAFGRHMHPDVGSALLASEKLLGASPPFENSIILIVSRSQDIVQGLIMNKPMAWEGVNGLDVRLQNMLKPAALGYGGPIVENHRPFLVLTLLQSLKDFSEVLPGVYFAFVAAKGGLLDMIHSGRLAPKDFWFFLGYSSWTWDQLQMELSQELWHLRDFTKDLAQWPPGWST